MIFLIVLISFFWYVFDCCLFGICFFWLFVFVGVGIFLFELVGNVNVFCFGFLFVVLLIDFFELLEFLF